MVTQWFNVIVGAALAVVTTAVLAIALWAGLQAAGVASATTVALLTALPFGIAIGGYFAGRTTWRSVFHGALTGLAMTGGIAIYATSSGGTASILALVGLLFGGMIIGGLGGLVGGRSRNRPER